MRIRHWWIIGILIAIIPLTGCVGEQTKERLKKTNTDEIEVLVPSYGNSYGNYSMRKPLEFAAFLYLGETGTKVTFTEINSPDVATYLQDRSFELLSEDAPEIILTDTQDTTLYSLVKNDALLPVRDKLENADCIYPGMSNEYIIPVGLTFPASGINTKVLEERGLNIPNFNWTYQEYLDLYDKVLAVEPVRLNGTLLGNFLSSELYTAPLIDDLTGEPLLSRERFDEMVLSLSEEFNSAKYITNDMYDYEYYYHLAMGHNGWEDYRLFKKDDDKHLLNELMYSFQNLLSSRSMNVEFYIADMKVMTSPRPNKGLYVAGMAVNRRSQNTDKALDFIDFYLSDEIQMRLFKNKSTYSLDIVNQNLYNQIIEYHNAYPLNEQTLAIRDTLYEQLRDGAYKAEWPMTKDQRNLRDEILYTVFQLALTEDHKDALIMDQRYNKLLNQLRIQALE